jgi:hypothetical protein|tara:strand:+ start:229 stop:1053 length:825 start_codon:yes stop_codon:yes gene_type:complete
MSLRTRRWRNITVTAFAAIVVASATTVSDLSLYQAEFLSGWLLLASMLLLAFYNVRKKLTMLPIGASAMWLQFHIYLGLLAVVIFILHVGWRAPNGWLEITLFTLFVLVAASGIVGLWLSRVLPKRLTRIGEEVLLERIPAFILRLRREAERVVLQSAKEEGSSTILDLYSRHLRPYFSGPRNMLQHLVASNRARFNLFNEIKHVERYLNAREMEHAEELYDLVRKKSELDFHFALQSALRAWLFVHVPLTYGLLILAFVHLVLVYAYGGGVNQ